jgi:hypothetical protein
MRVSFVVFFMPYKNLQKKLQANAFLRTAHCKKDWQIVCKKRQYA